MRVCVHLRSSAAGILLRLSIVLALVAVASIACAERPVSFRKQVAPLFASSCNACHGGSTPQSGLNLTTYALVMKGGRRGKTVVAGNPRQSLLVQYVDGTRQPRMPVGGQLKPVEIAMITRWIREGAKVDGDATAVASAAPVPRIPLRVKLLPQVASVVFSRDGKWLAAGTYQEVYLINPDSGKVEKTLRGHADVVRSLAFSPDGNILAAAGGLPGAGGEVKFWNLATGQCERTIIGHVDSIYGVAWRKDGKQLATVSYDKTVKLWDMTNPAPTADLKEHAEAVFGVAESASGKYFATAGADKSIRVWDAATGKRLYTLAGHTDMITALAAHPTNDVIASASADKTVRVWNLKPDGGDARHNLSGHPDVVTNVAFNADGSLLAASCQDGSVYVWDANSGGRKLNFKALDDAALCVAFRPDGKTLAVGGFDGSVKLFGVADGKLMSTPIAAPPPPQPSKPSAPAIPKPKAGKTPKA